MDEIDPTNQHSDVPESTGTKADKFFWWGFRYLPRGLLADSKLAAWTMDQLFIDCAWCLFSRGAFLGLLTGVILGVGATTIAFYLF